MTRINAGILPRALTDQHLIAEYREIGRICTQFKKRADQNKLKTIDYDFCLGSGHQSFFLDKGLFVSNRFSSLKSEMLRRGFSANLEFKNVWADCSRLDMFNDYVPTADCIKIVSERIISRLPKKPRYYGKNVSVEYAESLVRNYIAS